MKKQINAQYTERYLLNFEISLMNLDFKLATPSEICVKLGERLRAARVAKGWLQAEVALRAGVSRNTVLALETHGQGSISTLIRVATVLNFNDQLQSLFVVEKILSIKQLEAMHAATTRQRVRKPSSTEKKTLFSPKK